MVSEGVKEIMPVLSINLSHETYNFLVEGAKQETEGNVSEFLRSYCKVVRIGSKYDKALMEMTK